MNPWVALQADTYRQYSRFTLGCLLKGIVLRRTFRVIAAMRICQVVSTSRGLLKITLPFFILFFRMAAHAGAMDISWHTKIGGGLALTHGWCLVVSPGTKIGRNVTIFHGVTLGRRDKISDKGERLTEYPVIEDEVWIGPHAIIVGGITIGQGSRIAGGSFVTEDVPPYSIVSGNPAAIVRNNCTPDVMNSAPMK